MSAGDDAGDACVERELEDDAPHRGRRLLHRAHQTRRRLVQQEAEHQERQVQDIEIERVQWIAGGRKVAREIGDAQRHDQPRQQGRVFEPLPGSDRPRF